MLLEAVRTHGWTGTSSAAAAHQAVVEVVCTHRARSAAVAEADVPGVQDHGQRMVPPRS